MTMRDPKKDRCKYACCIFLLTGLLLVAAFAMNASAGDNLGDFRSLRERLVHDGFDTERVRAIYTRPEISFDIATLSRFFAHREGRLNYDQFATRKSIKKARKYINIYRHDLERAEQDFGVDKEVITAIILVETQLGTVTGNRSVLNSLSTFAALSDAAIQETVWQRISNPSGLSRAEFQKWSDRKSKWAYAELRAFLEYTGREQVNPLEVYGSIAGAMGIAQFMPSNILAYAQDGNADGRIDLFDHADAIASIASYLKHYGWRPGIGREKAYQVVYRYNHSKYYVNTILKITERLKG